MHFSASGGSHTAADVAAEIPPKLPGHGPTKRDPAHHQQKQHTHPRHKHTKHTERTDITPQHAHSQFGDTHKHERQRHVSAERQYKQSHVFLTPQPEHT